MRARHPLAVIVAAVVGGALLSPVLAADLKRFLGTFVGRAQEAGSTAGPREERDIDLVIGPEGKSGLALSWTNVTLVEGRRDVPGVKRRADEIRLVPAPGREFYLARGAYDPFSEKRAPDLLAGDALRWATISDREIKVYSLEILDDGRYELQAYTRSITGDGLALEWHRTVDGERIRHMMGKLVRAD